MTTYLGGCPLSEHDVDPDASNHRILPGEWVRADCKASDTARGDHDVKVWSSLSDTTGDFGVPLMFTEWGTPDGTRPVVADLRYIDSDKPCEHYVYEVSA